LRTFSMSSESLSEPLLAVLQLVQPLCRIGSFQRRTKRARHIVVGDGGVGETDDGTGPPASGKLGGVGVIDAEEKCDAAGEPPLVAGVEEGSV